MHQTTFGKSKNSTCFFSKRISILYRAHSKIHKKMQSTQYIHTIPFFCCYGCCCLIVVFVFMLFSFFLWYFNLSTIVQNRHQTIQSLKSKLIKANQIPIKTFTVYCVAIVYIMYLALFTLHCIFGKKKFTSTHARLSGKLGTHGQCNTSH